MGIVQDNIAKGKISSEVLSTIDVDAIEIYVKAAQQAANGDISHLSEDPAKLRANLLKFQERTKIVRDPDNDLYSGRIKENVRGWLEEMDKLTF